MKSIAGNIISKPCLLTKVSIHSFDVFFLGCGGESNPDIVESSYEHMKTINDYHNYMDTVHPHIHV